MDDVDALTELSRLNNELANLQRALAKKNLDLERLARLQREMLGMAAHDLRSPLSVVREYAAFLQREATGAMPPQHRRILGRIERSANAMVRIIDDLLDVARAEAGELRMDRRPVDLADIVEESVDLHRPMAASKGIELRVDAERSDPVPIDPARIEQVLANLSSNAIHFSRPNTVIDVRLGGGPDEVFVTVTDQGPGIVADEQQRLFKPFGRTSTKKTGNEPSTGLGLAISKRIVEAHGGRIWCTSEPGQGSTFGFALPRKAERR